MATNVKTPLLMTSPTLGDGGREGFLWRITLLIVSLLPLSMLLPMPCLPLLPHRLLHSPMINVSPPHMLLPFQILLMLILLPNLLLPFPYSCTVPSDCPAAGFLVFRGRLTLSLSLACAIVPSDVGWP
jgi:hypothetical protein